MIRVYFYYPRARVGAHRDPSCNYVRMGAKPGQRVVVVNAASFSAEIQKFTTHQHLFASHSGANNMWVDLDFNDADFEEVSVRYIKRLLSEYYSGWNNAEIEWHC